uniref:Si:dkey-78k11.9 n=1 Tax=Myripristis murdjan TaxID=586833 RepID=A0A667YAY1_9TELE
MRNGSCEQIYFDFAWRFLPGVYISVLIVGLTANAWGLKSLLQKWKKMGNINIFVLNLGLADILYLLTIPFLIDYHYRKSKWIFGDVFCKVTRFFFNLNLYGSIGFLACISLYRYLAIVHPMRVMGRITVTHSVVTTVVVWVLVSIQSLPDLFFAKSSENKTEKCFETTSDLYLEDYLTYSLGWTVIGFCIPFLITLGCYGHMFVILCSKNTIDKVLKQRSLKLLVILIVLFSVCYIPHHIFKNLNLKSRILSVQGQCPEWSNEVYVARQISRGLACLNSALNPLVYLHGNENTLLQLRQLLQRARRFYRGVRLLVIVI